MEISFLLWDREPKEEVTKSRRTDALVHWHWLIDYRQYIETNRKPVLKGAPTDPPLILISQYSFLVAYFPSLTFFFLPVTEKYEGSLSFWDIKTVKTICPSTAILSNSHSTVLNKACGSSNWMYQTKIAPGARTGKSHIHIYIVHICLLRLVWCWHETWLHSCCLCSSFLSMPLQMHNL